MNFVCYNSLSNITSGRVKDTRRQANEAMGSEVVRTFDQIALTTMSDTGDMTVACDVFPDECIGEFCSEHRLVCKRGEGFSEESGNEYNLRKLRNCMVVSNLVEDWFIQLVDNMPVVVTAPLQRSKDEHEAAGKITFCTSLINDSDPGADAGLGDDFDAHLGGGEGDGDGEKFLVHCSGFDADSDIFEVT